MRTVERKIRKEVKIIVERNEREKTKKQKKRKAERLFTTTTKFS